MKLEFIRGFVIMVIRVIGDEGNMSLESISEKAYGREELEVKLPYLPLRESPRRILTSFPGS